MCVCECVCVCVCVCLDALSRLFLEACLKLALGADGLTHKGDTLDTCCVPCSLARLSMTLVSLVE